MGNDSKLINRNISVDQVRELFDYDPVSGVVRNKVTRSGRAKAGDISGSIARYGYLRITLNYEQFFIHQIAFIHYYGWLPEIIDHINGNTSDNRIVNLRPVTHQENMMNRGVGVNNTSGVLGLQVVTDHRGRRRWLGRVMKNGTSKTKTAPFTELGRATIECWLSVTRNGLHGEYSSCRTTQEREITRDDFLKPADPIGTLPAVFHKRFVEEFRKVKARQEGRHE